MRKDNVSGMISIGLIPLVFLLPVILPNYWLHVFALIFIKIILCLSMRQMMLTGLLNLSIAAFMGIGAYFSALMMTTYGFSFWYILFFSGVVCSLIGFLLSFPLLKIKGVYFFLGTICFSVGITTLFSNFFVKTFGGMPGFAPVAMVKLHLMGLQVKFTSNLSHYYLTGIFALLSTIVMKRLEFSRYGLYWKAISQADRLIETVGVNLFKYKTFNFVITCFFAGLSGSLYAHIMGIITPNDFALEFQFILTTILVVGGFESFWGPVYGVFFLSILGEFLRGFGQYELIGYGFILLFTMIFTPKGIAGLVEKIYFLSWRKSSWGKNNTSVRSSEGLATSDSKMG
jgi:branched-chain amino acid transport system permease protein